MEVVLHPVDDHGSAQNFGDDKTFIVKRDPGISLVGKQGEQVSGVLGVLCLSWVKVASCILEICAAIAVFMDVHGVELGIARLELAWQAEKLRLHQSNQPQRST